MPKILIIDDCLEFAESTQLMLEQDGFEVVIVHHPDEARKSFDQHSFDLILCDLVMPVDIDLENPECDQAMDQESAVVGLHAIREFTSSHPEVPLIAMSGELTGAPINFIKEFGAKATLSKPFTRAELVGSIEKVLSSNKT